MAEVEVQTMDHFQQFAPVILAIDPSALHADGPEQVDGVLLQGCYTNLVGR
jgi:hypothetical protein